MASVSEQLRKLFPSEMLKELEKVRAVMVDDPTVFDNHSRELRQTPTMEKPDGKV